MVDVFTDFIVNNTSIQNILIVMLISGMIIALMMKGGVKNPSAIILSICLVFIYLYYSELIPITLFGGVIFGMSILLFFVLKLHKSE